MDARATELEEQATHASSKEDALRLVISAAEIYMKAMKVADDDVEKSRLKKNCLEALARAEEIKKTKRWPPAVQQPATSSKPLGRLQVPSSSRNLSTREEVILLENSKLNGLIFPPWKEEPSAEEFEMVGGKFYKYIPASAGAPGPTNFTRDESDMKISACQMKYFDGWKRPQEALYKQKVVADLPAVEFEPTMLAHDEVDLVQDVTTDCSVVASLCSAVAQPNNGCDKLLSSVFYPYDKSLNRPMVSKNGKYVFKLHFNGCCRKVVIDDRLPTLNTSRTLYVVDRQNPGLLWPALLEKAYLKVRGGYDFPGSNSGTDLWVLTGWIPEQMFLQSYELEPRDLWRRINKSFGFGDVLITLGTGRLSQSEEEGLGLAGEHDYAVLDMKEVDNRHMLLVKNPWCDGTVWKGTRPMTPQQPKFWTDELRETPEDRNKASSGTFWISFDEVIRNFESLYLNWNPSLFKYRQDHHFQWTIPSFTPPGSFTHNPQYSIRSSTGGVVWVLLSRHFSTDEQGILSSPTGSASTSSSPLGFISLYVFDAGGQRVHLSDDAMIRGPYVDSPQTLVRLDTPPKTTYTLVVAQQVLPLPKYSFTLSAYSRELVVVEQAAEPYPICKCLEGAWTVRTAGGNASSTSYPSNPQFSIQVASTTDINLFVETSRLELAVHVKMVWAGGQRVTAVTAKDIVGASGDYRRGCALAKIPRVAPGLYTVVCSTFEPGQTGKFSLRVESMLPCEVRPLPSEDAGRLSLRLPVLSFQQGVDRMLAPVIVSRMTRLRIVARHLAASQSRRSSMAKSPLKITLERGQGPHKSTLAVSGGDEFSDAPVGVRIGDVDISPELAGRRGVWLVVERFGVGEALDEVEIEVLSEARVEVGAWGTGDG